MSKINISVISCGRSDFSHYLPIISLINSDSRFNLKIVVFGSHLSKFFGSTKDEITSKGFKIYKEIDTMLSSDSNESIASSMGITTLKFANYWKNNSKDIILVLGDRYEMFSAVSASVPYNMRMLIFMAVKELKELLMINSEILSQDSHLFIYINRESQKGLFKY